MDAHMTSRPFHPLRDARDEIYQAPLFFCTHHIENWEEPGYDATWNQDLDWYPELILKE